MNTRRPLVSVFAAGAACVLLGDALQPASAQDLPSGFEVDTRLHGIDAATALTVSRDGRVFLAEQTGAIRIWKDGVLLRAPAIDLSAQLDTYWERGLIGITLHPEFPGTPYLFVVRVSRSPYPHHVVSRFTVKGDVVDPASERILLEGDDQTTLGGSVPAGHQGGIIRIGPDNRVYVGLGEQTAGRPSQLLDTLQGKILRINLDGTIPADNPFFLRTTGKYRTIWAVGIRNPFGLAFEPGTGRLFETDVGQSSFEEVNIIVPGGNYGWPDAEGPSQNPAFINPVHAYPPVIGRSIVGGTFYPPPGTLTSERNENASRPEGSPPNPSAGRPFPDRWRGRFFFADWASHWIKALDPKNPADVLTFARNLNAPVALEPGPDGSMWVLNRGTIWRDEKNFVPESGSLLRIVYKGAGGSTGGHGTAAPVPSTLAGTGLFRSLAPLVPGPGFTRFEINLPAWRPGVGARRWIRLPEGGRIQFSAAGEWGFPEGTVVVQHFALSDGSRQGQPFETQVVWFTGPRIVRAGAYRWTEGMPDANLVEDGEVTPLPGQPGRHWYSPGTELQLDLDTVVMGFQVPVNSRQINRRLPSIPNPGAGPSNQLEHWNALGWFEPKLDAGLLESLPRLAGPGEETAPLELRVRSYLDVNCSTCHRPGGLSRGLFDARIATPLREQGLIDGPLIAGGLGIADARVIVPGNPAKSILLERARRTDFFRMPQVAVNDEPQPVVPLLEEWIRRLPADLPAPQ